MTTNQNLLMNTQDVLIISGKSNCFPDQEEEKTNRARETLPCHLGIIRKNKYASNISASVTRDAFILNPSPDRLS